MSKYGMKEIREARGISDVVIAEILVDDANAFTTGEVEHLVGSSKLTKTTETSQETKFYDNLAQFVNTAEGDDTLSIDISLLDLETFAKITGKYYEKTKGALIETESKPKYFALGYKTQDTAGYSRYVWRYKTQFSIPSEEYNTKTGDAESNGQSLEVKCVYPTHQFTYMKGENKVTENVKAMIVSDEFYDGAETFLYKVTTPDELYPVSE